MTFFHDLNKRLAALASQQDARQITESATAQTPTSQLAQALNERDLGKHNNATTGFKALAKKTGGGEKGARIAGAQLAKMRAKGQVEESDMDESAFQAAIGKKKYGDQGMKALQKAGREHASAKTMSNIRNKYDKYDESQGMADEGNAFTGKLASTPKGGNFKLGDKTFKDTSNLEEGHCPTCDCAPCKCNEGNTFTAALKSTPKGGKFKVGGKEFTDTSSIEEGFKEMDAWMASREKEKGTGKFDKKERTLPGGMKATTYTRRHEDDKEDNDDSKSNQADKYASPKKKGRPKGKDKGPERVTAKSYKYKAGRPTKTKEDLDSDGVMMTRPSNMSSESFNPDEYDQEGDMTKDSLHTVIRHAEKLEQCLQDAENLPTWVIEKIGQIKGMMASVSDYVISSHERGAEQATGQEGIREPELDEEKVEAGKREFFDRLAPAAKKAAKVIKVMSRGKEAVEEKKESTAKKDTKAEKAGKKVAKDIEYDEGDKAKDDDKAEKAGKKVTKDIEYDDKKDAKEKKDGKEEKVDETTVAGSVATATTSGKSSKGSMSFGKGVYENFNNSIERMITESIDVAETVTENQGEGKTITVTASGPEADMLMQLLKAAGLSGQSQSQGCGCGNTPCSCEAVDEAYGDTDETLNNPDWPTNTEKLDAEPNLRTYSGGLNGPKSTGQSTVPVLASQLRRQASMEESVKLERNLFNTWKNYKG
jgi:hypothetical protein